MFYYSRDRGGEHAQAHLADYTGIFQADAFGGYNKLYEADRKPAPILEAACWAHARRPFFIMADVAANARRTAQGKTPGVISPLALEAVRRIDALFEIERSINGQSAERRRAVRQELSAPLLADLESWLREQRAKLSRGNDLAKAMDYMLKRWPAFTRFLDDGRICLSNNAAERALRGIALGRKSWLFAGSDRGGQRAAVMFTLIETAKLNDVDPQAWIRRLGLPTCSAGSTIIPPPDSPNSCPGTGRTRLPNWRHEPARKQRCIRQLQRDRHRSYRAARH